MTRGPVVAGSRSREFRRHRRPSGRAHEPCVFCRSPLTASMIPQSRSSDSRTGPCWSPMAWMTEPEAPVSTGIRRSGNASTQLDQSNQPRSPHSPVPPRKNRSGLRGDRVGGHSQGPHVVSGRRPRTGRWVRRGGPDGRRVHRHRWVGSGRDGYAFGLSLGSYAAEAPVSRFPGGRAVEEADEQHFMAARKGWRRRSRPHLVRLRASQQHRVDADSSPFRGAAPSCPWNDPP